VSVGAYVLDFYCPELKLAIEVDGSSHDSEDAQEYDHIRQKTIEAFGIRFLRFTNRQVRYEIEGVLEAIRAWILMERSAPP
jgi:very-short-patch-repair endonuclease